MKRYGKLTISNDWLSDMELPESYTIIEIISLENNESLVIVEIEEETANEEKA